LISVTCEIPVGLQASQKPLTVTIVDRPYKAGRHILNVQELQARILAKWPGSVVRVMHIEGLDLKQQIALFQHTSILIWTHGAAMADLLFLPQVVLLFCMSHLACVYCSSCMTLHGNQSGRGRNGHEQTPACCMLSVTLRLPAKMRSLVMA